MVLRAFLPPNADNKYIAIYGSVAFSDDRLDKPASYDYIKFRASKGCNRTYFRNPYNSVSRFIRHGWSSGRDGCWTILRSLQEPTALRRGHGSSWPGRLGCNKRRARQDAGQNQSAISRIMIRVAVDSDIFFFSISSNKGFLKKRNINPIEIKNHLQHLSSHAGKFQLSVPISVLGESVTLCLEGERNGRSQVFNSINA